MLDQLLSIDSMHSNILERSVGVHNDANDPASHDGSFSKLNVCTSREVSVNSHLS